MNFVVLFLDVFFKTMVLNSKLLLTLISSHLRIFPSASLLRATFIRSSAHVS